MQGAKLSKEDFFAVQQDYLKFRTPQVKNLLDFLNKHISLKGESLLSIGCGVAPELPLLKNNFPIRIGIDHNPSIIDFCKSTHSEQFICTSYLDFSPGRFDCILALDIDTNLPPISVIHTVLPALRKGGHLILTEREDNLRIYQRYLIPLQKIKQEFSTHKIQVFQRLNKEISKEDRDNIILIITYSNCTSDHSLKSFTGT